MYLYKLTLKCGKRYYIKDKEKNVIKFIETINRANTWRDFLLVEAEDCELVDFEGTKINTIMIRTDDIVAVEYALNLKGE